MEFNIADETKISYIASSRLTLANIKVTGNLPVDSLVAVGSDVYVGGEQGTIYRIQNNDSVLTQKDIFRSNIWPGQPSSPTAIYSDVTALTYNPIKGTIYAMVNNSYFTRNPAVYGFGNVIYEIGLPGKTSNSMYKIYSISNPGANYVNLGSDQVSSSNPLTYISGQTQTQLWLQN